MTESHVEKPLQIALILIASTLFFGIMTLFVKLASQTIPIPQIMFFRSFFSLLPVVALMWQRRGNLDLIKTRNFSGHFVRCFVGFFSMCCYFWSFSMLPLANVTAIQFATPLIVTALSVVLLDERVGPHRWTAVLIGLGAVFYMLQPASLGDPVGSVMAMCAAILAAFAMIAVRKLGRTEHSLTIVFYFTLFSSILSGVWTSFLWKTPDALELCYLVVLGLMGGGGQIALTYAYSKAPAGFISPFFYLSIVMAAFLDLIVWHLWPSWEIVIGSIVVITSGLYIVWRETRKHYAPTGVPEIDVTPVMPTEKDNESPV